MIKIVCDKCGREVYMKNPDLSGRAKIGIEEYDLCKYCIFDIKRFINQGKANHKTENSSEKPNNSTTEDCSTVPTISKMEQVDKDINARSKDEPQTYITEDRDTQILDAWQVHHRNTTTVEDESQTDCAWK